MFTSAWRRWMNRWSPRAEAVWHSGGRLRPLVERLEERCVPSTVRTIVYNQLTALPDNTLSHGDITNRISADGAKAIFTTGSNGVYQVYTINTDGTGQTLVDADAGTTDVDFSADGSVVLETVDHGANGTDFNVVNGSGKYLAFHAAYPAGVGARLSPDGSTIFFADHWSPTGDATTYPQGLYSVSAAGGDSPHLIASDAQIAALVGDGTTAAQISLQDVLNTGVRTTLGASTDGNRLVFTALRDGRGFLMGVNRDGSGLHLVGPVNSAGGFDYVSNAGISADGGTVFRYDSTNINGTGLLAVYHFDGTGGHTLALPAGRHANAENYPELVQLTADGSKLLLGSSGLLLNTDGSGAFDLGTDSGQYAISPGGDPPGLYHVTMDESATRFVYTVFVPNGNYQLATAELNPASLGAAPAVSDVAVTPGYLLTQDRSSVAVRATVSAAGTVQVVYPSFLTDGVKVYEDFFHNIQKLFDDGQSGDGPANDGVYGRQGISAGTTVTGPRTVRVLAQTLGADGKLHATAVEVDGLNIVIEAPAPNLQFSASAYAVGESAGTQTITVTRTVNTTGTVTVHYATSDGTAHAGTDYVASSGDLTFNDGETTKTFTVAVNNDALQNGMRTLNLTLSSPSGGGADLGTPATATLTILDDELVRTITYNQLTALPDSALRYASISNRISADGKKALLTTNEGGAYKVYTINTDGSTGPTLIDPDAGTTDVDFSADGSVVLETIDHGNNGLDFRVVNGDGSNPHLAFHAAYPASVGARLSADGSTIFFADHWSPTGDQDNDPEGLYYVSAAGGDSPHLMASTAQIAARIGGGATAADISVQVYHTDGVQGTLGASADGNRLVFEAFFPHGQGFLMGVNRDGSGLHPIGPVTPPDGFGDLANAGISADGGTVFRYDTASFNGPQALMTVYRFDGTGGHAVAVPAGRHANTGTTDLVQLTADGSKLLLGSSALLLNTDGSGAFDLGTDSGQYAISPGGDPPGLFHITMDGSGTRFVYTVFVPYDTYQLVVAELDPASLGAAPVITNVSVTPGYLLTQGRSLIDVRASVSGAGAVQVVYPSFLRGGVKVYEDYFNNIQQMHDDGLSGDGEASNGVYGRTSISSDTTVTGPRTVRVLAQVLGADGKLHATAVEIGGLTVVTDAPTPPASSVGALPAYTASTSIPVSWSGSDAGGPGIASYDVYVSDNGGPFVPFQKATTATSATFSGLDGHTYGFTSVATDTNGVRQDTPSGAQATTLVDVKPPTSAVGPLPAYSTSTTFTVTWSGGDSSPGSGLASYAVFYSDNGGALKTFLTATTQTSAPFTGLDGHTYSFYTLATDRAVNVQTVAGPAQTITVVLPAEHLVIHAPGQAVAGGPLVVTVNAVNPDGITDPQYSGSVALVLIGGPAGGRLTGNVVAAVQGGVATFTAVSLNVVGGGYKLLAASSDVLVAGVFAPITAVAPQKFTVAGVPVTMTAGVPFTFSVTALTSANQTSAGYVGTIHFTSSDLQAVLPPDATFVAGDHGRKTFTVTLKTAGSQTISVADVNGGVVGGKSAAVSVTAAAASSFRIMGYPFTDIAGAAHAITVTAVDAFGNQATGYRGRAQLSSDDSAALPVPAYTFVAADQGSHAFSATLMTAGTWLWKAADTSKPATSGSQTNIKVLAFTAGIAGPSQGPRNEALTFSLTAAESGATTGTIFTYKIDWDGNGTVDQTVSGPAGTMVTHAFAATGNNTVKMTATDGAGNVTPQAAVMTVNVKTLALVSDPADGSKTALVIEGTSGNDVITITPADSTGMTVSVTINNVVQAGGPFAPSGHILVYGRGGNDTIQEVTKVIAGKTVTVAVPAVLVAGAGNSTLSAAGSSANNVLVGGGGKNSLTGGSGRDVLIGGAGASTLRAGGGGDLLIAGRTAYDADTAALLAILAEWGRTDRDYIGRVQDLFGVGSGGLNGSARLTPQSVTTAGGVDQLFGGAGQDWFWIAASASATDQVSNPTPGDVVTFQ